MQTETENTLLIRELMTRLLKINGYTRNSLSELLGCTPQTMTNFLTGKSEMSLSATQIQKLFEAFSIDLQPYLKRLDYAESVAKIFKEKNYNAEDVAHFDRAEFIEKSGVEELKVLPDYDVKEFVNTYDTKLVDMQSSFANFQALVVRQMKLNKIGNVTPGNVKKADLQLAAVKDLENKPMQIDELSTKKSISKKVVYGLLVGSLSLATCLLINTAFTKKRQ